MKNVKAVAASAAMVMAAALGTGSLLAWQQSTAAAPVLTQPTEIVVEYVDAPVAESTAPAAQETVVPAGASTTPVEAAQAMSDEHEEHEEHEEHGEYGEYEDGDDDD